MKPWNVLLIVLLSLSGSLQAVETAFWQVASFEEFLQGDLTGVSLSKEGELTLAPETTAVFTPEEALALSIAADREGNIYLGTGHQGKVFRLDRNLKSSMILKTQEPDIFAVTVGPEGAIYVGSSPEGKVYRVAPDGKPKVFYEPRVKYIWALAFDRQGRLYVGTGDKGQILRVDPDGKGELFFDSKQTHIMCLTFDPQGNLLAGSVPNGLIYRINPQGRAFVLYQSSLPEIHDMITDSEGRIYAATLGGTGGKGAQELFMAPTTPAGGPATVTTITVTASDEASSSSQKRQTPPAEVQAAPSFNRATPSTLSPAPYQMGQGKGSLVEILPDNSTETIWSSNNESIFGLALRNNRVMFSTDSGGRIFELDPARDGQRMTLLTETRETLATRLLLERGNLYAATSNVAKLFRIESSPGREGTYESPVKDTKFISQWGVIAWRGKTPPGTTQDFYTRSGNSDKPDKTWSDWAGPYRDPNGSPIQSPAARYIQWKAVFKTTGSATPVLDDVTLTYLNQNLPPQIRSLNVSTAGERTSPTGTSTGTGIPPGTTITVGTSSLGYGTSTTPSGPPAKTPVTFSWQADDPNGDQLVYSLYLKATDEQEWHLLKDKLHQTNYTLEANILPDGKYEAKLVASDEEANPPLKARRAELESPPFWIDNTPPAVRVLRQTVADEGAEVRFQAEDSTSPLRSAEFSVDGKDWRDASADDGIVDSRRESFTVRIPRLDPGEHIVALRAFDTSGNGGVGKAVVRIPGTPSPAP
jgi:sugar lactone lactonase YvrE